MSNLFVSAFYDIGRSSWSKNEFIRSIDVYFERFFSLLDNVNETFFVFLDERYVDKILNCKSTRKISIIKNSNKIELELKTIYILPINEIFLQNNIWAWQQITIEDYIMNTNEYKKHIHYDYYKSNSGLCPETFCAPYNCINHAKIDFVNYVLETYNHNNFKWFSWIDFGYIREPLIQLPKDNCFHFDLVQFYAEQTKCEDNIMIFIAQSNPFDSNKLQFDFHANLEFMREIIIGVSGPFWMGTLNAIKKYQNYYHELLNEMHYEVGIADDDQSVVQIFLNRIFKNELIVDFKTVIFLNTLHSYGLGWFSAFYLFNSTVNQNSLVICPHQKKLVTLTSLQSITTINQIEHNKLSSQQLQEIINKTNKRICNSVQTDLCYLLFKYGSDKTSLKDWHNYSLLYSELFRDYQFSAKNILEIGIGTNYLDVKSSMGLNGKPGASLRAFRDFFKNANIIGADIDTRILFEEPRINTYYVDQTKRDTLIDLVSHFHEPFDILIDDGLHEAFANKNCFEFFFPDWIQPGGLYIIEDIHINYAEEMKSYVEIIKQNSKLMAFIEFIEFIHLNHYRNRFDNNIILIKRKMISE